MVLGCLVVGEFLGALKEFCYTGNPSTPYWFWQGWEFSVSSTGLEEIESLRIQGFATVVPRFRGCITVMRLMVLRKGWGLGRNLGLRVPTSPGSA